MILTKMQYELETGYSHVYTFDVVEKPNTYKSNSRIFYKNEEEEVRFLKGSYNSPYLEVYTLDIKNPTEKLQSLISNWLEKRASLVPFKIIENRSWKYDINIVRKYMESIKLEDYGLENENFPLKEDVQKIYDELNTLQNPGYWDLQTAVATLLREIQEEIELD